MIQSKPELKGSYSLCVTRPDGSTETVTCDNLVTDIGRGTAETYSLLMGGGLYYLELGDDASTPPDPSNTSLNNQIYRFSGSETVTTYPPTTNGKTFLYTNTWELDAGAVVGTIREVGGDNSWNFCSHSLLSDSDGNPAELEVTANDQLTVVYTVSIKAGTFDVSTVLNLLGTDRTVRFIQVNPQNLNSPNATSLNPPSSLMIFNSEITETLVEGQTFDANAYTWQQQSLSIPHSHPTGNGAIDLTFTLTTDLANDVEGIYAIGLRGSSGGSNEPAMLMTFRNSDDTAASPLMKTDSDLLDFIINVSLIGINV